MAIRTHEMPPTEASDPISPSWQLSTLAGFHWQTQRRWPIILSALLHVLFLGFVTLPRSLPSPAEPLPEKQGSVILVPPAGSKEPNTTPTQEDDKRSTLATPLEPEGQPNNDTAPNDLTISIKRDPTEELQRALQKWDGHLGFGEPGNPLYFKYLIRASDWQRVEADRNLFKLEGYFVLRLTKVEQWRFLEPVRVKNSIPSGFVVYALFPLPFYDALDAAIRRELERGHQLQNVVPTQVEIAFATEVTEGFRVRILATKPL